MAAIDNERVMSHLLTEQQTGDPRYADFIAAMDGLSAGCGDTDQQNRLADLEIAARAADALLGLPDEQ